MNHKPSAARARSTTTTGITASVVDVAGVVGGADGAGDGAAETTAELGAVDADGAGWLGAAEGADDGAVDAAAATVNVVVPRATSPSSAEAVVQRTV